MYVGMWMINMPHLVRNGQNFGCSQSVCVQIDCPGKKWFGHKDTLAALWKIGAATGLLQNTDQIWSVFQLLDQIHIVHVR